MTARIAVFSFILGLAILLDAQTNVAPILTTNYVTAVPWFREVNGQLYNTERSVSWSAYRGQISAVLSSNSIVFQDLKSVPTAYRIGAYTGRSIPIAWEDVPGQKFIMLNCPDKEMAVGDQITLKAMQVGITNYNGDVLRLYDCGKPHVVAVVTTNYPSAKPSRVGAR